MQIKDLSVSEAHLADVRGGINNVTGKIHDDAFAKNDADVDVYGDAVTFSGGIGVSQGLNAQKELSLSMPVSEKRSDVFALDISNSAFDIGFPRVRVC